MKELICTSCGSHEFIKNKKYLVCDYCKTEFLLEENSVPNTASSPKVAIKSIPTQQTHKSEEQPQKNGSCLKILVVFYLLYLGLPDFFSFWGSLSKDDLSLTMTHFYSAFASFNLILNLLTGRSIFLTNKLKFWQVFLLTFFVIWILRGFFAIFFGIPFVN